MRNVMNIVATPKVRQLSKISSETNFKKGQRFDAKIVGISQDKTNVTIKLRDGSEFVAKLDCKLSDIKSGFISFEVDGFEDGNLKLKLSYNNADKNTPKQDCMDLFLKSLGLDSSKKDIAIKLLSINVNLTKENIENLSVLLDFRDKASLDPKAIDNFINSYINSKNIESDVKCMEISDKLIKFFDSFKSMTDDEILMFLYNDVEFNEKNISSYNKIFKEEGIFKAIEAFKDITNIDDLDNKTMVSKLDNFLDELDVYENNKMKKEHTSSENANNDLIKEGSIKSDLNKDFIVEKGLIEAKSLSKQEVLAKENLIIKELIKGVNEALSLNGKILDNNKTKETLEVLLKYINNTNVKESAKFDFNVGKAVEKLINKFNNLTNSDVDIAKNIITKAKSELTKIVSDNSKVTIFDVDTFEGLENLKISKTNAKDASIDMFLKDFKNVKLSLEDRQEFMKSILKDLSDKLLKNDLGTASVMAALKNNINDFKLFNDVNSNYYYLDVPLKLEEEYPCKLIIKDDRKGSDGVDSSRIKLVVIVSSKKLGNVDGFVDINKKNLRVELKAQPKSVGVLEKNKDKLYKSLELLGFLPYIFVSEKKEMAQSNIANYRDFFSSNNTIGIDRKV